MLTELRGSRILLKTLHFLDRIGPVIASANTTHPAGSCARPGACPELSDAIIGFLAERNTNARRYVWQAKGEEILRKITIAREKLAAVQVG